MSFIKLPAVLQVLGVAVFGITVWKGVHGFMPTVGLISGAGMAYFGKHFGELYRRK
jgi:type IV secretory pathway VirB2 component (pilin)